MKFYIYLLLCCFLGIFSCNEENQDSSQVDETTEEDSNQEVDEEEKTQRIPK